MIRSFKRRGLKRLYQRGDASRINPSLLERIEEVLSLLDAARSPKSMNLPGYKLHKLKGEFGEFYSVRVSGNWRIVFRFETEPEDVDLVDYH